MSNDLNNRIKNFFECHGFNGDTEDTRYNIFSKDGLKTFSGIRIPFVR